MTRYFISLISLTALLAAGPLTLFSQQPRPSNSERAAMHREAPDAFTRPLQPGPKRTSPAYRYTGEGFFTAQANVDASGNNILGDAANEPSIAINPVNPNQIAIGWRQFDDVFNSFRQAGWGFSADGGVHWTFPGRIDAGVFRSDPVLDADASGNLYYNSLTNFTGAYTCNVYKSSDGGATWDAGVEAHGGDKQWMTIDVSGGPGNGNMYSAWNSFYSSCSPGFFTRSANNGASFEDCIEVDGAPYWGTMAVGPSGELFVAGAGASEGVMVVKSTNAQAPGSTIAWSSIGYASLDGFIVGQDPINPVGLIGQACVDVDCGNGPGHGNVYVLCSVSRNSVFDPADVMFAKSTDGGLNFSEPVRINDDETGNYQWFGTMSVAPNGRIDVIWLDTRENPGTYLSALYYCYSADQGATWSINKRISDFFDPQVGYPQQQKMGDYFDMKSDDGGAHLAWANTLNGEEDVYYTHITPNIVGLNESRNAEDLSTIRCYPNPFKGQTAVQYTLSRSAGVRGELIGPLGTVVQRFDEGRQDAGSHTITLQGGSLLPGVYTFRLTVDGQTRVVKLVRAW